MIAAFFSTGMIIWATIGLAGLIGGMVTVGVTKRQNQPSEHPTVEASQPATAENGQPVTADSLTVAA